MVASALRTPWPWLATAAVLFFLFQPGFFLLDDFALLASPVLAGADGWWRVLAGWTRTRPVTEFSFWCSMMASGQNAVGWLAVQLALAAGCAWAFARLSKSSWVVAPLLLLHPVAIDLWHYSFARSALLCGLFALLALQAWDRQKLARALTFGALALLSKEDAVVLPFCFALWSWSKGELALGWNRQTKAIAAMAALAALAGLRTVAATSAVKGSGAGFGSANGPLTYLLMQGKVVWVYAAKALVGWETSLDPAAPAGDAVGAAGWVGLLLLCGLALRLRGRRLGPGLWFTLALLWLLPSSSFLPADDLIAYRRMYLPMGFFVLGVVEWALAGRDRWQAAMCGGLVALQLLVGASQWAKWQSPATLWQSEVRQNPEALRPRLQLARAQSGQPALETLAEAAKKWPDSAAVASEKGRVFLEMQQPAEALREFGRALAISPNDGRAILNRGVALQVLGQKEAAIADFTRALSNDPCLLAARQNLAALGVTAPSSPALCP